MPNDQYKSVTELSDLPEGSHYAILESDTVYTPGDERSRTHPGHGYPESWDNIIRYTAYFTKEALIKEIERRTHSTYRRDNFKVIQVQPITFSTSVNVQFK